MIVSRPVSHVEDSTKIAKAWRALDADELIKFTTLLLGTY